MINKNSDIIDNLINDWKTERPDLDASSMAIVGRILKLGKVLEKRAGKSLQASGIHYTDLDVLATLRRSGEPYALTPKELMQSVIITSGAMTALLDRLVKLKLIYRAPDEKDGRIKRAVLTIKGVEIIDKAIAVRFKEATNSVSIFNNTEKDQLSGLLKKLSLFLDQD